MCCLLYTSSAVLLICSLLDTDTIRRWIKLCDSLGLSALVEAHTADEVYSAIAAGGVAGEAAMARYGSTAMTPYHTVECLHKAYLPYES